MTPTAQSPSVGGIQFSTYKGDPIANRSHGITNAIEAMAVFAPRGRLVPASTGQCSTAQPLLRMSMRTLMPLTAPTRECAVTRCRS